MISVNNLTIRFGNFELFSDIGFLINKRDRIGLVGKNGAGKSTLLKVINGDISPNEGNISVPTDIKIGYLPQQMILENAKLSVFEEARTAFQNVLEIQTEIDKLNVQIANYHDYTEDEYSKLIEKLT
ncbi:MAG: ATP-binding cassette domain-containing protein, partial [Bacteroidales bacterium]